MAELSWTIRTPDETEALAAELSLMARPGQFVLLRGELGVGKSVFARAFIRALAGGRVDFDIPSPSFTLIQTYTETRIPVAHVDLYRLSASSEAAELGLEDLIRTHVVLIEWPGRLGEGPDDGVLDVAISGEGQGREIQLTATGTWETALARNSAIRAFLDKTPWRHSTRIFLEGDASFRRYEVLEGGSAPRAILMDMQARPDGPPVKDGKPYSAVARLAEDIRAVIAVNRHLVSLGYSAPVTHAFNIQTGLAVIEDLGNRVFGAMRLAGEDMAEPMRAAAAVLADMAEKTWPPRVAVDDRESYVIPPYDIDAQLIEADLLPSWFWPYLHGIAVPQAIRDSFAAHWKAVLPRTVATSPVWTLRDYHSPNLLWLPEREGLKRVGLIDTQDCVLGHPAYDLASLLQDARVDIPAEEERSLFEHYCSLRGASFDRQEFEAAYAILGAQRATKILGIFARLSKRDGKHGYLPHLPRVSLNLERNLQHPVLAGLKAWYAEHLPQNMRESKA